MKRKCVQCGKDFFLSKSELDFYRSKKLAFPKRCKECRNANKKNSANAYSDDEKEKSTIKGANGESHKDTKKDSYINKNKDKNKDTYINNDENRDKVSGKETNVEFSKKTDGKKDDLNNKKKNSNGKKAVAGTAAALAVVASALFGNNLVNSNSANNMTLTQYYAVEEVQTENDADADYEEIDYTFKNSELREEHYEKHGVEMGFDDSSDYEEAASKVVNNKNALHKTEAEDGDDVYYLEGTNEFVIVSKSGYIRTYFNPEAGIAYYNRQ